MQQSVRVTRITAGNRTVEFQIGINNPTMKVNG